VGDAQDERSRRALPAKARQRLPHRDEDVLGEVVALGAWRRVARDRAPQRGTVLADDFVEGHDR
jgi:hypothetical protein